MFVGDDGNSSEKNLVRGSLSEEPTGLSKVNSDANVVELGNMSSCPDTVGSIHTPPEEARASTCINEVEQESFTEKLVALTKQDCGIR